MATMGFIKSQEDTKIATSSIIVPETFTHSIAFGQTGCGKTTSFIYPNLQQRLKLGHGILLYDYKGKEHLSVKYLADNIGRLDDVVEIGKPWGESINMIERMDEEELDHFFDNVLKHGDDNKYWQNSAKSLGQSILKVLKAIDGFYKCISKTDENFSKDRIYIEAGSYYYPTKRTFTSLIKVCKTFETLGSFIENLDSLLSKTQVMIIDSAKTMIDRETEIESFKPIYANLVRSRKRLIDAVTEATDSLDNFGKDSNENLTQNIIGSLTSPLLSISQNSFFNTDSFDIVSALNSGKIVVINTEALSNAALESLNNVILHELSKRTRSININPISIFIDEAQRVLSKTTDLPIDVLREAKVDVFLSTQNSALFKDKLSSEKFDALMGNLTQKYYFNNSTDEEIESENLLNLLDIFEFISSGDDFSKVNISEPLYISVNEKMNIEYKYQKKSKVLLEYAYAYHRKKIILEYIPRLYKDKKLLAINIKTMKEEIIDSYNLKDMTLTDREVISLFQEAVDELNNDANYKYEYEMVDDEQNINLAS